MIEQEETPKTGLSRKTYIYITIISLFIVCVLVIYFQRKSLKEEEALYSKSMTEMTNDIIQLKEELKSLRKEKMIVSHKKDSLQHNLDYLWLYKTLVQTAKLRDDVGEKFSFKPGDKVRLKADSSGVVITDMVVGGSEFNYYVRFKVKNKKGESFEVSPLELEQ